MFLNQDRAQVLCELMESMDPQQAAFEMGLGSIDDMIYQGEEDNRWGIKEMPQNILISGGDGLAQDEFEDLTGDARFIRSDTINMDNEFKVTSQRWGPQQPKVVYRGKARYINGMWLSNSVWDR